MKYHAVLALLCAIVVLRAEGAMLEDAEIVGVTKLDNIRGVFSAEECLALCITTTSCASAVFNVVADACKLFDVTHVTGGTLIDSPGNTYVLDGTVGCMNEYASNFDAHAVLSDNTCEYPPDAVIGCGDEVALNYDSNVDIPLNEDFCTYRSPFSKWEGTQLVLTSYVDRIRRALSYDQCCEKCLAIPGCMGINYRENLKRCYLLGERYGDPGSLLVVRDTYVHASIGYSGCTDSRALNFDKFAYYDNDSCLYDEEIWSFGCKLSLAFNYDPDADVHDEALCDFYGYWSFYNNTQYIRDNAMARVGRPTYAFIDNMVECRKACEQLEGCVAFAFLQFRWCIMYDHYEIEPDADGNNGTVHSVGYEFYVNPHYYGCPHTYATNYHETSVIDDGSCVFPEGSTFGCRDVNATNYEPDVNVHFDHMCDYDLHWERFNHTRYVREYPVRKYDRPATYKADTMEWCRTRCELDETCVAFNFLRYRHCHLFAEASFEIVDGLEEYANGTVTQEDWIFFRRTRTYGCIDERALNYNSTALRDDGSCEYPGAEVMGCADTEAANYGTMVTIDNRTMCNYVPSFVELNHTRYVGTNPISTIEIARTVPSHVEACASHCASNGNCIALTVTPKYGVPIKCTLYNEVRLWEDRFGRHGLLSDQEFTTRIHPDHYTQ